MGAVFLAYDAKLHRPVALKLMDEPADGETSRSRLVHEARNAAALNHPNICTIHEVGHASGTTFIAMEYVEGRSLRDRLEEGGALPQEDALRYGIQAADALAYAHEHGVVHRDFKAANAMITAEGRLKVVDFGLARRGDALMTDATTMGSLVPPGVPAGTPYAMAPEQVRGETTDARTDIWALGVLLYEMVTGTKPFNAATTPELFSAIMKEAPRPWPGGVAVAIKPVVERCLEKDPARRYQDARAVHLALEKIQSGLVPLWTTWRYHLVRRRRLAMTAVLLGIAAVAVGINVGGLRERLAGTPPEAYEAYLRGSSYVDRLTLADLDVALRYFELALEKDSTYALAYTGVYRVWATRQQLVPALRREAEAPRRAALAKALELDDMLPEVHASLASQAVTDWNWAAADGSFRRAIDLNPSFGEARAFYSQYLNQMRRPDEAMAQIEHAFKVDPLNPTVQSLYGLALNSARRHDEAIVQFRGVLRATPGSSVALAGLQGALLALGRKEEALEMQRRRAGARGDSDLDQALAPGNAVEGSDPALRRAVAVLEARWRTEGNVNEMQIALMYLRLREPERALDWLERAYETHNPNLPSINNRRPFDPLRTNPRFLALLRRMNLPM